MALTFSCAHATDAFTTKCNHSIASSDRRIQHEMCNSATTQIQHFLLRGGDQDATRNTGRGWWRHTPFASHRTTIICSSEEGEDPLAENRRQRYMAIALSACSFTVMGAKCALPAVLALLTSQSTGLTYSIDASPEQQMARQLTRAALAIAVGKLTLGPVIDHFGGIFSLKVALSSLTALLFTMSLSQSFFLFAGCYTLVDFIFSAIWAASINAIYQSFDKTKWTNQIGNLAAAARAGNSLAFFFFAFILQVFENRGMRQYWRPVFFAAALVQLPAITFISIFGQKKRQPMVDRNAQERLSFDSHDTLPPRKGSLTTLCRVTSTLDFWLHLVSRTSLMIFASFLMFVPKLMTEVYRTTPAQGAQAGALYALGSFLSVTTLSKIYPRLGRQARLYTVCLLLLVGATGSSIAQLGHVSLWWSINPRLSAFSMFLWGLSFSIPFYIPPALYALSKGGQESSATIADAFDIAGFALLAPFNGFVGAIPLSDLSAWSTTFMITTGCSIMSCMTLALAIWRETKFRD